MGTRRKTAPLNIYVAPELKAAAMRAAKADQRSLTSLVEKLLTDYCRATGYLPPDTPPAARKGKAK
jgi:predicted HicB family RNase H-like nuclease